MTKMGNKFGYVILNSKQTELVIMMKYMTIIYNVNGDATFHNDNDNHNDDDNNDDYDDDDE